MLVASLTLLPWRSGAAGPPTRGGLIGSTGIQAPAAAAGVLAALLATGVVAWLGAATLPGRSPVRRPPAGVVLGLSAAALVCVLIKLIATGLDGLAVGAWISTVVAVALVSVPVRDRARPPA